MALVNALNVRNFSGRYYLLALTDDSRLDAYMRRLDVLNRGFAGYNTKWAIPVFEKVIIWPLAPGAFLIVQSVLQNEMPEKTFL
jgi:hypothetical protein